MKKQIMLAALLAFVFLLAGCRGQKAEEESGYKIWYMNQEETRLSYECRELETEDAEELVTGLLTIMKEAPEMEGFKPVLPENVWAENFQIEQDHLYLDFTPEYLNMPMVYEVLCRAALVRTLCQVPGIDYVGIRIGGQPLVDLDGKAVGLMNEEEFIENAGEEINAYTTAELTLPFEGAYPVIPENTKLISIAIRDEICYVNLSEEFLKPGYNVTESIPIYSIVNSLIENTSAQKVQISIEGETNRIFRESISFDTIFEKNEKMRSWWNEAKAASLAGVGSISAFPDSSCGGFL